MNTVSFSWVVGLFALQYFCLIPPCCLQRLRSEHQEGDCPYEQQSDEQLGDPYRGMIREIGENNIFEEQVGERQDDYR